MAQYTTQKRTKMVMASMAMVGITREIRQASSPTMRGHFGCIFKDIEEYTMGVWWAFYMRIMGT